MHLYLLVLYYSYVGSTVFGRMEYLILVEPFASYGKV
jgi:hypothetical protein